MVAHNDITGDKIQTKTKLSKQGEQNFDKIFGIKKKTNGGWIPPVTITDNLCTICDKSLVTTKECAWTGCPLNWNEDRVDTIGQNGNNGEHYEK